jgi:hypothetical protein
MRRHSGPFHVMLKMQSPQARVQDRVQLQARGQEKQARRNGEAD